MLLYLNNKTFRALFYILTNSVFWIIVHLFSSYIIFFIPKKFFSLNNKLFKNISKNYSLAFYEKLLGIKKWKAVLPEAGNFYKIEPFSKKKIISKKEEYLKRYHFETMRGEMAHIIPFLLYPISWIWNPFIADIIMFLFCFLFNFPFILILRYNRLRISMILKTYFNQNY
jgi:glycosyl-4,4'-diaponeurosporenoate acyltransferase